MLGSLNNKNVNLEFSNHNIGVQLFSYLRSFYIRIYLSEKLTQFYFSKQQIVVKRKYVCSSDNYNNNKGNNY